MATIHHFSPEEQAELLNNPYTARVTECRVYFTLAFKKSLAEITNKVNPFNSTPAES